MFSLVPAACQLVVFWVFLHFPFQAKRCHCLPGLSVWPGLWGLTVIVSSWDLQTQRKRLSWLAQKFRTFQAWASKLVLSAPFNVFFALVILSNSLPLTCKVNPKPPTQCLFPIEVQSTCPENGESERGMATLSFAFSFSFSFSSSSSFFFLFPHVF